MISLSGNSSQLPIRICFLIDTLSIAGVEQQLISLINQLDRSKIVPILTCLAPRTAEAAALVPENCEAHWLGVSGSVYHPATIRRGLRFARFLRRNQIHVLNLDLPASILFGAPFGRLARVPLIIRTRRGLEEWTTPREWRIARWYSRLVDLTIVNCEAVRQSVLELERPRPESVVILKNDLDLSQFLTLPVPVEHDGKSPRVVGMVANLRFVKGPDVFLEAASLLARSDQNVVFRMVGAGPMRPWLEDRIAELGLRDRVQLLGRIADLPGFLQTLDVAVLSSRSEGMPCALLEYMAGARPVVATSVGGTTEVVEHEVNGLLVPPERPAELAAAIQCQLTERRQAVRMAQAARARVQEEYGGPNIARRYEELVLKRFAVPNALHPASPSADDLAVTRQPE